VDAHAEELKQTRLRCPTCGFDMSDAASLEPDLDEEDNADFDEKGRTL
jgi:hypothetical protein